MIILIDAKEVFDKNQQPFIIKILNKVGILQHIKVIHGKPRASTIHNSEKLKAFPLRSGTRQ